MTAGPARIPHQLSWRGRRGAVPSGDLEPRRAESYLIVRRALRGEKDPLGGVHRRPQQEAGEERGLNSRRFRDLSRTDASGANLQVFWSAVDHRPDALEIGQPAPLADIVGMGYLASAHRALAADFTSLRHRRNPPRIPHTGVELNSTGGVDLQVLGSLKPRKTVHHGELCCAKKLH